MAIANAAIANTDTTLVTVPASTRYAVTTIMVCNVWTPNPADPAEGETFFDMHFVKSGDPRNDTNMVIKRLILPAGETFTFDSEKVILEAGDKVVLVGILPTNLSATISYLEV